MSAAQDSTFRDGINTNGFGHFIFRGRTTISSTTQLKIQLRSVISHSATIGQNIAGITEIGNIIEIYKVK
jgi:hypothetical protein